MSKKKVKRKMIRAACNFFRCMPDDLRAEKMYYAVDKNEYRQVFAADHTHVKCHCRYSGGRISTEIYA